MRRCMCRSGFGGRRAAPDDTVRIKPSASPTSRLDGWKLSPVHVIAAAAIFVLACMGLWDYWQAAGSVSNATPVRLQGATARFMRSDRNQKAFIFENSEGSRVWLIKTDLLLVLPKGQEFRVHCAWSGRTCEHLQHSSQRGPIEAVVLPIEFSPHHWLVEATLDGKVLAQEQEQRQALRSKLNKDRNLLLAIIAAVVIVLWWTWWLRSPNPSKVRRSK